jgi:hypothetical protein
MTNDVLLNDFAIRSFRDIADADYIAARMTYRASLITQHLWASQQAIEKYLKCILLLNRICATDVKHDLGACLSKINSSGKLMLDLTQPTRNSSTTSIRVAASGTLKSRFMRWATTSSDWTGPFGSFAVTAPFPISANDPISGTAFQRQRCDSLADILKGLSTM